jgi:hypothetical protein
MNFTDSVDEIVAFIMAIGGVAVLLGGLYGICISLCEIPIDDLLIISGAMLGPSTGYLFGKSVPHREKRDLHVSNYNK